MLQPGPRYDMQRPRYTAERASMFWAANILSAYLAARFTSASCPAVRPAIAYGGKARLDVSIAERHNAPLRQDPRSLYLQTRRYQQVPDAATRYGRLARAAAKLALTIFL